MVKVVLGQLLSDLRCATADYGVIACVVIWRAAKNACTNDAFAEQVILVSKTVFNNIAEKEPALLARPEDRAIEDIADGTLDELLLDFGRWIVLVHVTPPQSEDCTSDYSSIEYSP
jgi:hypothetical protein